MTPHDKPMIIAVDDEPLVLRSLVRILELDYRVRTYERGDAALSDLEAGAPCDAILCDMRLGDMTGAMFHERLRTARPDLAERILFLTGSDATPPGSAFLARHQARVLLKPFRAHELRQLLERVLRP